IVVAVGRINVEVGVHGLQRAISWFELSTCSLGFRSVQAFADFGDSLYCVNLGTGLWSCPQKKLTEYACHICWEINQ
ncbi:MAG: hypothetical protein PHH74_03820, partial [Candidatus Cloacimonetes bacterium]|nr:hypothetical protein [Candidatus Cloacimonadota bacterium]